MYYYFLYYVALFNNLNLEMQSENIKIRFLYSKIENVLRTLVECCIKKEYLDETEIENIQYEDTDNFVQSNILNKFIKDLMQKHIN